MIVLVPLAVGLLITLARENADVIAPRIVHLATRLIQSDWREEVEREWLEADRFFSDKPLTRILRALSLFGASGRLGVAKVRLVLQEGWSYRQVHMVRILSPIVAGPAMAIITGNPTFTLYMMLAPIMAGVSHFDKRRKAQRMPQSDSEIWTTLEIEMVTVDEEQVPAWLGEAWRVSEDGMHAIGTFLESTEST